MLVSARSYLLVPLKTESILSEQTETNGHAKQLLYREGLPYHLVEAILLIKWLCYAKVLRLFLGFVVNSLENM